MSLVQSIDAVLTLKGSFYDINFDSTGDIETADFLDTSIIMSLLTDARASDSEMPIPQNRRGWIGDEDDPSFNSGSKIWLYEQARLTRTTMNGVGDAAESSLQWLLDEDIALEQTVSTFLSGNSGLNVLIETQRPNSEVESRSFPLWENTGKR